MIYHRCVGCKKDKLFARVRTYTVPNHLLKDQPHLAQINRATSDGRLCGECFDNIRLMTLGIPKSRAKRLVIWAKSLIIKATI